MLREQRLTTIWLTASLVAISACAPSAPGNFCDVVPGPIGFEAETAEQIVRTDRPAAEQIDAQNTYGREQCPW